MKSLILSILFGIISYGIYNYIDNHNKEELHTYICYKKYNTSDKSGNMYFYMILKSESNYMFDIKVTPSTYFTTKEKSKVKFNLKPSVFDPNYNSLKITILELFFLLNIITSIISISIFVVNMIFGENEEKDINEAEILSRY